MSSTSTTPSYVILWQIPYAARHWAEFKTFGEASDTLRKWSAETPNTTYILAKVIGETATS